VTESQGSDLRDVPTVLDLLQRVADANFVGHRGARLVVDTGYGEAVIPVRPWAPPPPERQPWGGKP